MLRCARFKQDAEKVRQRVLASFRPQRTQRVRLGPSLAAALLDAFFEHPAGYSPVVALD